VSGEVVSEELAEKKTEILPQQKEDGRTPQMQGKLFNVDSRPSACVCLLKKRRNILRSVPSTTHDLSCHW
jgi:hypothetical protein